VVAVDIGHDHLQPARPHAHDTGRNAVNIHKPIDLGSHATDVPSAGAGWGFNRH